MVNYYKAGLLKGGASSLEGTLALGQKLEEQKAKRQKEIADLMEELSAKNDIVRMGAPVTPATAAPLMKPQDVNPNPVTVGGLPGVPAIPPVMPGIRDLEQREMPFDYPQDSAPAQAAPQEQLISELTGQPAQHEIPITQQDLYNIAKARLEGKFDKLTDFKITPKQFTTKIVTPEGNVVYQSEAEKGTESVKLAGQRAAQKAKGYLLDTGTGTFSFDGKPVKSSDIPANADIKTWNSKTSENREIGIAVREDQFNERRWERFTTSVNSLKAGSRQALGVAATANMRADRLLEIMKTPGASTTEIHAAVADLAGIFQGGVPPIIALENSSYITYNIELAKILTFISGKPESANSPEIQERLIKVAMGLKQIDNKIIKDNFGTQSVAFEPLMKADPERAERLLNSVMKSTEGIPEVLPAATINAIQTKVDKLRTAGWTDAQIKADFATSKFAKKIDINAFLAR